MLYEEISKEFASLEACKFEYLAFGMVILEVSCREMQISDLMY